MNRPRLASGKHMYGRSIAAPRVRKILTVVEVRFSSSASLDTGRPNIWHVFPLNIENAPGHGANPRIRS